MFDFSLSEMALTLLVALVVIGPKELPAVMRTLGRSLAKLKLLGGEVREAFDEMMNEAGAGDIKKDINKHANYIRDEAGRLQRVYDISDFLSEEEAAKLTKRDEAS